MSEDLYHIKLYAEEGIKMCKKKLKGIWEMEMVKGMIIGYESVLRHIEWMEKENAKH